MGPLARGDLAARVPALPVAKDATEEALGLVALLALHLDPVKHDDSRTRAHDEPAVREPPDVRLVGEVAAELGVELAPDELVLPAFALRRAGGVRVRDERRGAWCGGERRGGGGTTRRGARTDGGGGGWGIVARDGRARLAGGAGGRIWDESFLRACAAY